MYHTQNSEVNNIELYEGGGGDSNIQEKYFQDKKDFLFGKKNERIIV